jgi:hypothetical protein
MLLDAPCPHHKVPVKHTLRECWLIKNYVKGTLKPKMADSSRSKAPPPTLTTVWGLHSLEKMARCT